MPPGSTACMPASCGGAQRHVHRRPAFGGVHRVAVEQPGAEIVQPGGTHQVEQRRRGSRSSIAVLEMSRVRSSSDTVNRSARPGSAANSARMLRSRGGRPGRQGAGGVHGRGKGQIAGHAPLIAQNDRSGTLGAARSRAGPHVSVILLVVPTRIASSPSHSKVMHQGPLMGRSSGSVAHAACGSRSQAGSCLPAFGPPRAGRPQSHPHPLDMVRTDTGCIGRFRRTPPGCGFRKLQRIMLGRVRSRTDNV